MSIAQQLINYAFRFPKSYLKKVKRQGGFLNVVSVEHAKRRMLKASEYLIITQPDLSASLGFSFLTGKKFWFQTLFCMKSLTQTSSHSLQFTIYDDGSFDNDFITKAKEQVSGIKIVTQTEILERLDMYLPVSKFPFLRNKRFVYPHIKKLTDIHAGSMGYKTVLDSDMLFFNEPVDLIKWMRAPQNAFYILDFDNAYGYSFEIMQTLTGYPVKEKVNVGIVGIQSESIDWEKLEYWGKTLEEQERTSYYLEQALTAMMISNQDNTVGLREDYIVNPTKEDVLAKRGLLHHYVDTSKEWYFKNAWRNFIR